MLTEQQEKQALFDISYNHIIAQGAPSHDAHGDCVYRTPDGLQCAAGPFITRYTSVMDRYSGYEWESLIRAFRDDVDPLAIKHSVLISALQFAHDISAEGTDSPVEFLEEYELCMTELAKEQGLEVPA